MAGLFGVRNAEARKRALLAESEVLRETLRLELRNFRFYSVTVRKRFSTLSALRPWLFLGAPIVSFIRGRKRRRRSGKLRAIGTAFTLWRLYRKFGPVVRQIVPEIARGAHARHRDAAVG